MFETRLIMLLKNELYSNTDTAQMWIKNWLTFQKVTLKKWGGVIIKHQYFCWDLKKKISVCILR